MRQLIPAALLLLSNMAATAATPPPVEHFFRHLEFQSIQISPDGEHFAATVPEEAGRSLVVFRRADRKVTGVARFTDAREVGSFSWISANRIAFTITDRVGSRVAPVPRGELFFMTVEGKERVAYAGGNRVTRLVARLQDDDDTAYVIDNVPSQRREEDEAFLYKVNPRNGKSTRIASSPVPNATFLVDVLTGQPVMAWGSRGHRQSEVHSWDRDQESWRKIYTEAEGKAVMMPRGMHPDGVRFYALLSEAKGPHGLYLVSPDGSRELVVRDEVSDPTGFEGSLDARSLLAVDFAATGRKRHYLLPDHPDAKLLQALDRTFPGQRVSFVNASLDRQLVVFLVSASHNPGEFYLYDRGQKKAEYLAARAEWIDPELLSPSRPIRYQARDGTAIHGWLTVPKGSAGKDLPLVVLPHGGPHGVHDDGSYNPEVQLLASRGYAVLQPNFRGSGGFGEAFERAGYRRWGTEMMDDISDGTQWAIAEGIADPARICIAGGSFGAYAALMSVAREPERYRCAVGLFGAYDLALWYRRGDAKDSSYGIDYLEEVLGDDRGVLGQHSPAQQAGRIKVPVMLVAGEKDRRAPPVQSERMAEALREAGKGELIEVFEIGKGEGHGYFAVENNARLYRQMLEFLDRHIGKPDSQG
jgi:dipeptidyl aminopeptidase/acylaminoacyl peptidase